MFTFLHSRPFRITCEARLIRNFGGMEGAHLRAQNEFLARQNYMLMNMALYAPNPTIQSLEGQVGQQAQTRWQRMTGGGRFPLQNPLIGPLNSYPESFAKRSANLGNRAQFYQQQMGYMPYQPMMMASPHMIGPMPMMGPTMNYGPAPMGQQTYTNTAPHLTGFGRPHPEGPAPTVRRGRRPARVPNPDYVPLPPVEGPQPEVLNNGVVAFREEVPTSPERRRLGDIINSLRAVAARQPENSASRYEMEGMVIQLELVISLKDNVETVAQRNGLPGARSVARDLTEQMREFMRILPASSRKEVVDIVTSAGTFIVDPIPASPYEMTIDATDPMNIIFDVRYQSSINRGGTAGGVSGRRGSTGSRTGGGGETNRTGTNTEPQGKTKTETANKSDGSAIKKRQEELKALTGRLSESEKTEGSRKRSADELDKRIGELETEAKNSETLFKGLEKQQQEAEAQVTKLETQRQELEKSLEDIPAKQKLQEEKMNRDLQELEKSLSEPGADLKTIAQAIKNMQQAIKSSQDDMRTRLDTARKELTATQLRVKETRASITAVQLQVKQAQTAVKAVQSRLSQMRLERDRAREELTKASDDLNKLRKQQQELKKKIESA